VNSYRVYYSMRGYLIVDAASEKAAEEIGYERLRKGDTGEVDDREIHCAEEE